MPPNQPSDDGQEPCVPRAFVTTHWSLVVAARGEDDIRASEAMEKLCRAYWFPIYAEVRRRGFNSHDAEDMTQEFFACLLRRGSFAGADRAKGRFRSFLLGALKYFLADQYDRRNAEKRGGGRSLLSLDEAGAERRFGEHPAPGLTPDQAFDQRWAMALMEHAFSRLAAEFGEQDKSALFAELKPFLAAETDEGGYAGPAQRLHMSTSAVAVAVHRMRQRFRELIRSEAAETLANLTDVDDELRHLFGSE